MGIGWKKDEQPHLNTPEHVVPHDQTGIDLPSFAWDLLPYGQRPLDLYCAHFWYARFIHEKRTPFAALYASLGCRFAFVFWMFIIVNHTESDDYVNASHY